MLSHVLESYHQLKMQTTHKNPPRTTRVPRLHDSGELQADINMPPGGHGENSAVEILELMLAALRCRNKTSVDSNQTTAADKQGAAAGELESKLPRFGPTFGKDKPVIEAAKKEALEHVLKEEQKSTGDEEQSSGHRTYLSAIKKRQINPRTLYPNVDRPKKSEFQQTMVLDGCFFLQLALCILGGSKLLGYPEKHTYFGTPNEKDISCWMKAMFFVGNQIPYAVIRALMEQSFFQGVITRGLKEWKWDPPSDLPKLALYLVVVWPEIERNSRAFPSRFQKLQAQIKKLPSFPEDPREEPRDILHGFHYLLLGPRKKGELNGGEPAGDEPDLEAGGTTEYQQGPSKRFPSAKEIKYAGIQLRKGKHGAREIHFCQHFWLFAHLYVPPFTFNGGTEDMLRCIKNFEEEQPPGKNDREVAAYLRFMRDLIQTPKDVEILVSKGIIKFETQRQEDKDRKQECMARKEECMTRLPGMLNRLVSSKDDKLTEELRLINLRITDHPRPPWHLLSLALFLTVLQTIFTILSYVKPRG